MEVQERTVEEGGSLVSLTPAAAVKIRALMDDRPHRLRLPARQDPEGTRRARQGPAHACAAAHEGARCASARVRTGRGRIFRNKEITADVLLASACLPTMFHAIEIDGEPYWDGGYAGNPTLTPLVRESDAHDTILVQINPRYVLAAQDLGASAWRSFFAVTLPLSVTWPWSVCSSAKARVIVANRASKVGVFIVVFEI